MPALNDPEPTAVLVLATILYLVYHYGSLALVRRADGAAWGVHAQRLLGFVVLGVVPAVLTSALLPGGLRAHGLALTPAWRPSAMFLGLIAMVVLPIVTLAARKPAQWAHYPQIRRPRWTSRDHLANALSWGLYLLAYELFFRGVLTFALVRAFGWWPGLATMTALYVAVHLPKPAGETVGTLPMGFVFGVTALLSGAIWAPWLGHWMVAVTSDAASATFAARAAARGEDPSEVS